MGFTPVPSPLLGNLLAEISDPAELRVTLRFIWLVNQKKGIPRPVRLDELAADRVIAAALGARGDALESKVAGALQAAVDRGTLLELEGEEIPAFVLNTEPERRAVARLKRNRVGDRARGEVRAEPAPVVPEKPNIFVLYEQNIGPLTPIVGQILNDARLSFPEEWIKEAIQIAVANNARNWKYVSAILDRWASEGRSREQPGRDLQEDRLEPYRRAYGRYIKRG